MGGCRLLLKSSVPLWVPLLREIHLQDPGNRAFPRWAPPVAGTAASWLDFCRAEKTWLLESPCLCMLGCYFGHLVVGAVSSALAAFAFRAFSFPPDCHSVNLERSWGGGGGVGTAWEKEMTSAN